jgi:hypothetical protein
MSKGPSVDTSTEEYDQTALEDESLSSAQEAVPLPWFWGRVQIATRFITPIYGQRAQQAKNDRPQGKK